MEDKLFYNKPATSWMEGLPIGNGRLAAMVWGNREMDQLSLNHEWLWRGVHRDRDNQPCAEQLQEVRRFLTEGDYFRATCLANTYFAGLGGVAGLGRRVDPYQPAGDMCFLLDDVMSYTKRELDINKAVATAARETSAATVHSTFIAHPVFQHIFGIWRAKSGVFSGTLWFSRTKDEHAVYQSEITDNKIIFTCKFEGGIRYLVEIKLKTDGHVTKTAEGLRIENAANLQVQINIATSESGMEKELEKYMVPEIEWGELLRSHEEAFSSLLNRLDLAVTVPETNLPTDERILALKAGASDPGLILLYFNYGRYLLASSSICGELPANLQGKWNDNINPPWECDYHFDINIQMNYWMAEAANMHECAEALLQYIERLIPHGKKAAMDLYGCRGVYLPITNDAWGRATPEACGWAAWIGAAPWIAQHFWWHYLYSGDIIFLKDRAYPFFKEVTLFFEDYLIEDQEGRLQILPSQSPENRFEGTGLWPVSIGISSAMDVQLVYDAFGYAIKSGTILGGDQELVSHWKHMQSKLPPFRIGTDGRLLEWDMERVEVEPGHRHLSHLYGLFPSDLFNPVERPEQYKAAIQSLKERLSHGGGHTGWSRAWVACLYARIGDADGLWEHLHALIKDFATISLLDLHPPFIFQIDGNLGAAAAVLEGLVQFWGGKLHLLRALPSAWKNGRIAGVKAPGGHELVMEWEEGKVVSIEITMGFSEEAVLADMAHFLTKKEASLYMHNKNISIRKKGTDIVVKGKKGTRVTL